MNNNPLVSIIVRTKDRPKLLVRALKSIASQTYRPIEAVLVNDGGCDLDIGEIRQTLGDVSVNYIRLETNTGRAHAGNVGIENAKGEYIGFLDDDDEFYPEHVETLVSFLKHSDYKVAYTGVEIVFQEYVAENENLVDIGKGLFSENFSYSKLLIGNYIPFNSVLMERKVATDLIGLDEQFELYEDWDFFIRVGEKYNFCHIDRITARYIQWSKDLQINRADKSEEKAKHMREIKLRVIEKHIDKITPDIVENIHENIERLKMEMQEERQIHLRDIEQMQEERQIHLRDIEQMQEERQIHLRDIEQMQEERQIHLRDIEQMQEERQIHLRDIERLKDEISQIHSSIGWKLLEKYRRVVKRILPINSSRRRIYDLLIKILKTVNDEGIYGFVIKVRNTIRQYSYHKIVILKKAYEFFKKYGLKNFIKYAYQYLIIGRVPVKKTYVYLNDIYEQWIKKNEQHDELEIKEKIEAFKYKPKISIITPVYNLDPKWLNKCIESVINQFYDNWELCLYDDGSTNSDTLNFLKYCSERDRRIKVSFGAQNRGISAASNAALTLASGEFIALLDSDDELSPNALYENVKLLNLFPDTDMIYSDEDKIDALDYRYEPFFKPDWSPQLLFSFMYTGHLTVYRKSLIDAVGGFRSEFDFSQDYDLTLRVTEKTDRIKHIPKILYHWRSIQGSAASGGKDYARESNINALKSAIQRRGYDAEVLEYPFANRVKFNIKKYPMVSIIIPTDVKDNIFTCIELLLKNTLYPRYEIVVVTNSALGEEIRGYFRDDDKIKLCRFDKPFNFSLKCNEGVAASSGEFVLFLNDDIEAIDGTWLEDMVRVFGRGNIGGVSPKLFYENDTIQYSGMVTGVRGLVGTAFHCQPKDSNFYFNMIQSERNVRLLSGACMLLPKKLFEEIGGFDTVNTPIMHSDIDLCFRILEKGYELVYTPSAALRHIGHLSLGAVEKNKAKTEKETHDMYLLKKWGDYLGDDPFYTHNMKYFLYEGGQYYYRLFAGRQDDSFLNSKNILFITHDLSLSGAPILMYDLACQFKKRGYFVVVMSPCDGKLRDSYQKENIPLMIDSSISEHPFEATIRFMANFDFIVINTLVMWRIVLLTKAINMPIIWFIHESEFGLRWIDSNDDMQKALAVADYVVFVGEKTKALYKKYDKKNNFRVINYAAKPISLPHEIHTIDKEKARLTILHIGSIEPRKGQDIFIRSINKIPERYIQGIEVVMIGRRFDNPVASKYYDDIVNSANKYGNVRIHGEVPHEKISYYIERTDIFVCTSRDEVGPLTVLEAMSAGKAIISSDVGGVSSMIRAGEDGLIFSPDDADALAKHIIYLYDNRDEIKRLGDNARKRFYDNFTIDKQADSLLSIINSRLKAKEVSE